VLKHILILLSLSTLVACATSEEGQEEDLHADRSRGSDCISQGSIRDYTVLDDANLIVSASAKRRYHLELSRRAYGLRSSWKIAFQSPTGRICGGFSDIIADDGFGPEKIRIRSIRQLTPEDEEALLIRFGKIEPEYEQPREPEEVDGAEVEELD
jgi:hypothetical protein